MDVNVLLKKYSKTFDFLKEYYEIKLNKKVKINFSNNEFSFCRETPDFFEIIISRANVSIFLQILDDLATYQGIYINAEKILYSLLSHEMGHAQYTNFNLSPKIARNQDLMSVFNALEDNRIEYNISQWNVKANFKTFRFIFQDIVLSKYLDDYTRENIGLINTLLMLIRTVDRKTFIKFLISFFAKVYQQEKDKVESLVADIIKLDKEFTLLGDEGYEEIRKEEIAILVYDNIVKLFNPEQNQTQSKSKKSKSKKSKSKESKPKESKEEEEKEEKEDDSDDNNEEDNEEEKEEENDDDNEDDEEENEEEKEEENEEDNEEEKEEENEEDNEEENDDDNEDDEEDEENDNNDDNEDDSADEEEENDDDNEDDEEDEESDSHFLEEVFENSKEDVFDAKNSLEKEYIMDELEYSEQTLIIEKSNPRNILNDDYHKYKVSAFDTKIRAGIKGMGTSKRISGDIKDFNYNRYISREHSKEYKMFDKTSLHTQGGGKPKIMFYFDISGSMFKEKYSEEYKSRISRLRAVLDYLKSFYDVMNKYIDIRFFCFGACVYSVGRNELDERFISYNCATGNTIPIDIKRRKEEEVIILTDGEWYRKPLNIVKNAQIIVLECDSTSINFYEWGAKNVLKTDMSNLYQTFERTTEIIKNRLR